MYKCCTNVIKINHLINKVVCFFHFVTLRAPKLECPLSHVWILLESPWWVEMHWSGFIMFNFTCTLQELLNIIFKFRNKSKKICQGNLGILMVPLGTFRWSGFYGSDFVIFRPTWCINSKTKSTLLQNRWILWFKN